MNKTVNQNGDVIIAVGQKGSPIRCKEEYNVTLPKLVDKLNKGTIIFNELRNICAEDNVPQEDVLFLIRAAQFYFQYPSKLKD